ncbi:heme-degrading domain-containing protein [Brucella pseudintermedia]|uniref:heme-degrading domain-containing protein n=1 Tax=Brucella pseudintermedia TaxID=370111 RepID=UPI001588ECB6|nr:heme-degrading domain-containing protein [Brucella pseudintermedia]
MAQSDDSKQAIAQIIRQEQALIFPSFDENEAFALGSRIRDIAVKENLGIAIEISLWDRQLFYATTTGSTVDNQEWLRRKFNVVRRFHASTYRLVLEQNRDDRMFAPHKALNVEDYALAGGGFPIRVGGAGVIGAVIVSGLPQREDHNLVVRAVAGHLGQDPVALALPAV